MTLKQYQSQLNEINDFLEVKKEQQKHLQKEINLKLEIKKGLEKKIKEIKEVKEITLSEHSLVRFAERVLGFDVEEITQSLITDALKKQVEVLGGNGSFPFEYKGIKGSLKMKNYTITTITN